MSRTACGFRHPCAVCSQAMKPYTTIRALLFVLPLLLATSLFGQSLSEPITTAVARNDWKQVETLVRKELKTNPGDVHRMTLLALSLAQQKRHPQALEQAKATIAKHPTSYPPRMIAASSLMHLGRNSDAILMFESARKIAPDSAEPAMALGMLLATTGRCDDAITHLEDALFRRPDNGSIIHQLTKCYLQLGRIFEATDLATRGAELEPNLAVAQLLAGETLMAAMKSDQAIPFLERAIALGSANSAYLLQTAALQDRGRTQEALAVATEYAKRAPNDAMAWYNLGLLQIESQQLDSSVKSLRRALAIKPNYSEAYYNLGRVYDVLGFSEDAIQAFRRCATTSGAFAADSYHALALLYRKLGSFDEAMRAHGQAISINDSADVYHAERLRTCVDAERCADAAPFIDRDVTRFPENPNVLFQAARCYLRNNKREQVELILPVLERIDPALAGQLKTAMRM
ncbi:MAG: tetratricopeptide repeat protein [Candidatus Kapabacteria bacterium]|nr:tetratricopeptide repeat protein [Candidatus Kapabacteria bacterium]